jgi:CDP-4-dehydro-6-deoxyglucose reductase, E1
MAARKMRVPFGTLSLTETAKEHIAEALDSCRLTSGKFVRQLEDAFADLVGVKEAVAVSSGADADALALAVLHDFGARRGDEVIIPALSFVATGNAVLQAGFTPVFVDVERATLNIDPNRIEPAITERTRAIMPVHLMGKPAEMDTITAIARKHDLVVIEDAAEAHGALYKGRPAGALGEMAAFSLYAAHIISAVEGGIVTTNNAEYANIVRSLRAHGRACACRECRLSTAQEFCPNRFDHAGEDTRFRFDRIGFSCKMNELEAAVGLGNVAIFDDIVEKRHANLMHALDGLTRFAPYIDSIEQGPNERIGPHAIPLVIQEEAPFTRRELTGFLEEHGIETRTLFASMPTQCKGFKDLGHHPGEFPNAEYIGEHGLHVGVHQDLGLEEMDYLLETLQLFLEERLP